MLRIHFQDADLGAVRVAAAPNPLWEIATSLHRFQTRAGRWAYADWHRTVRVRLREQGLDRALRTILLPLFPRASYFPDFLTRGPGVEGLDAGLDTILATSARRVSREVATLARRVGAPPWAARLTELDERRELVRVLRAYHEAGIAPYAEGIRARFDAERMLRCRGFVHDGVDGLLGGAGPPMRWERPVLHVDYPASHRDLRLDGRGLTLVPTYFCWRTPNSLADPELPPVLCYPVLRGADAPPPDPRLADDPTVPLAALLGRTRAMALCAAADGATTGEIARAAGVSAASASRHATALRDAGLITSSRHATSVLHTLTPAGASVLRAASRGNAS
ncbi:MarR family transcriptional regulator [Streptomyces candidus]|uniref:DNA-binding transcriptional ArsR family regulator n=1 Tax=Streptomyces candidus TaxID=67283 RepID=A0A7X0LRA2_9ACTN|nr:helix-turn-helix domain-containing protein [Streptomyces candidus]MBB6437922.1 DNA-binding transcriptional ArsR family regulator [Streptomyces candidus]GHH49727.1 transcriptional regulator [Streptomyces candidus]